MALDQKDNILESTAYRSLMERIQTEGAEELERQDAAFARKLVEGALAYAKGLGFEPHADYRIAGSIFGDIDSAACPVEFEFGRDGKPLYIRCPDNSLAMQRRILKQIERHCGPGGSDYLLELNAGDALRQ